MSSKKLSVKIISVIISLTFLVEPLGLKAEAPSRAENNLHSSLGLKPGDFCEGLTSAIPSHASSALRPNLMGDNSKGAIRLETTVKEMQRKFSIKPVWTFVGWGKARKAIREQFHTTKDRKEAMILLTAFVREFTKNKIDPRYTLLYAIPALVKLAKTPQELKDIFDSLLNLNIKLAENKIDPRYTLRDAILALAKIAETPQDVKDMCDYLLSLNIKLVENNIDPTFTMHSAIPAIAEIVTLQNVKDMCDYLSNLNIRLAENERNRNFISYSAIPALAKGAKNLQELKNRCDAFLNSSGVNENKGMALEPLFAPWLSSQNTCL